MDRMTAARIPFRVPRSTTPAQAASAQRNSRVRKARIWRKSAGLMRPTDVAMTTAASVAWGMRPMTGARNRSVARVTPAVTRAATCVRAPALRFTAVCEVPPPPGMAPQSPPSTLAAPVATSSWLGSGRGSPGAVKARPAAIVSVKLMRAMATAAGHSGSRSARSGRTSAGSPPGMCPTTATPLACRPRKNEAAMPPATPSSGAGNVGAMCSSAKTTARVASPTARVAGSVSGRWRTNEATSRNHPALS